jgi:hypothetical protein
MTSAEPEIMPETVNFATPVIIEEGEKVQFDYSGGTMVNENTIDDGRFPTSTCSTMLFTVPRGRRSGNLAYGRIPSLVLTHGGKHQMVRKCHYCSVR